MFTLTDGGEVDLTSNWCITALDYTKKIVSLVSENF
jgi:hypothetical protein